MDWADYKALCDQPDYWSRWMLEQCLELFRQLDEAALCGDIDAALACPPLALPDDHKGSDATRMFMLSMPRERRLHALCAMELAVEQGLHTAATRGRGLGGFVEAWREFADCPA